MIPKKIDVKEKPVTRQAKAELAMGKMLNSLPTKEKKPVKR